MNVDERMDALVGWLISGGLATASQIKGCSGEQAWRLESRYEAMGFQFPRAYRLYLERMGRGAGRFLSGEFSASYSDVSRMTREQRKVIAENRMEWRTAIEDALLDGKRLIYLTPSPSVWFDLPDTALIICGRYNEQFWFILCDSAPADDAPVFYFSWQDDLETAGKVYDSLFDFWNGIADEAERRLDAKGD